MKTFEIPTGLTDSTMYEYASRQRLAVYRIKSLPECLSEDQRQEWLDRAVESIASDFVRNPDISISASERKADSQALTIESVPAKTAGAKGKKKATTTPLYRVFFGMVQFDSGVTTLLQGMFAGNSRTAAQEFDKALDSIKKRDARASKTLTIEEGDPPTRGTRQAGLVEFQLPDEFVSQDHFVLARQEEQLQLHFAKAGGSVDNSALSVRTLNVPRWNGSMQKVEQLAAFAQQPVPPEYQSTFSPADTELYLRKIRSSIR